MNLTDADARKAVAVLLSQRKLRPAQVVAAARAHDRMISELRQRLAALEGGAAPARARRSRKRPARRATRARRKPVSAQRKAAMVRQGKYLAAIRRLNVRDRAKVKATLISKGYAAAMQEAKRMSK